MPNIRSPRKGSLQYWPRKRAKRIIPRIKSWPTSKVVKPLAFIGYKVGMGHLIAIDNRKNSPTKNEEIFIPFTLLECPPLKVGGITFYLNQQKIFTLLANDLDKELSRKIPLPKKPAKKGEEISNFDDLRLLVYSQPKLTGIGQKKPQTIEVALAGKKEEKLNYGREKLGKEIKINEVFEVGNQVDVHGVTKGKGFQGTVKRYGVKIRQHKSGKTKRGIGSLGPWTPKRVDWSVPMPGKMGFHSRTEYNKWVMKIADPKEIEKNEGYHKYGIIKNPCLLLKGSVAGNKKQPLCLVKAIRPNKKILPEVPEIKTIII